MVKEIFISHYHKDEKDYDNLINLLNQRKYFTYTNNSIPPSTAGNAQNEQYISQKIRERVNTSDVVIVMIGPETHERKWVNWEIEYAHKQNKRIIGVFCRGAKDSDIPEALDRYGSALVGWDTENIINAIRGKNSWQDTNGNPRAPAFDPDRIC